METQIERTMDQTMLYIETKEDCDSFELAMLRHGVPGVLPTMVEKYHNHLCYAYNITQKVSLTQYAKHETIDAAFISTFLKRLIQIIRGGKDYLLEDRGFVLGCDMIYLGNGPEELYLCYFVGYDRPLQQQFTALFEEWMEIIDYSDRRTVQLVYDLHRVSRLQTCTFDELLALLDTEEEEQKRDISISMSRDLFQELPAKEAVTGFVGLEEIATGEKEELYYPKLYYLYLFMGAIGCILCILVGVRTGIIKNRYGKIDEIKLGAISVFCGGVLIYLWRLLFVKKGKLSRMISTVESISLTKEPVEASCFMQQTRQPSYDVIIPKTKEARENIKSAEEDIEMEEMTQLLCEDKTQLLYQKRALLLRPKEEKAEPILVSKEREVIGSLSSLADIVISHKTISRRHAEFLYKDGNYYIKDLESTNGTYLNDKKLEQGKMVMLHSGDEVKFAECAYEVVIQE